MPCSKQMCCFFLRRVNVSSCASERVRSIWRYIHVHRDAWARTCILLNPNAQLVGNGKNPTVLSSTCLPPRTSRWTPLGAAMLAKVTWPRVLARRPAPLSGAVQSQPCRRLEALRPPEGIARARRGLTAGAPAAKRFCPRGWRGNPRPAEPAPAARGGLQPRFARSLWAPAPRWDGRSQSGKRGIRYL